ncbi:Helicase conserved C-terminal domain-containing protein [Jatrophihabitans endophyticus]|uniref:Helicase conserved C-terminal domain-containing protein n=1 Tax=Jatrophihabitans endophyticus TaxID=1206085 RepID=A0A1M5T996_9ACTN|nr:DEAD/DEAH box helicase [Jatrophihabitans endophyticus]SHH46943.1 Helicase conserved C-terminal domain-containing protein [Jatrophihabitans endophyticus]
MPSSTRRGAAARRPHAADRPATESSGSPQRAPQQRGPQQRRRGQQGRRGSRGPAAAPARSGWDALDIRVAPTENLPTFADLGLPRPLVRALERAGIAAPFPIQAATIPDALAGRDVLGRAATGSGKTLGFGLPLLARLAGQPAAPRRPRGLVLVPTRELAMQVADALTPLASSLGTSVRLVAGGLPIGKQIASLERGVDVLVATPGRLEDLIERRACDLADVEICVLDEADHMADLGFLPVVRRLLDQTAAGGQRLLFSATLDGDVALLVDRYLSDPAAHAVRPAETSVDTMTHHVFRVAHEAKFEVAAEILGREGRTIGFVRTKHGADRMARNLGRIGVAAGVLHGGRTQAQRTKALDAFKDGSVPVLIATDVAARGIHVDDVSLVLHVDPPNDHKDYLHRSGRTARAGESGTVVLLATPEVERDVRGLFTAAGLRPEQRDVAANDPVVADLTGARAPSGVSVLPPKQPRPAKASNQSKQASNRPRRPGRPQQQTGGERRPRRERRPH